MEGHASALDLNKNMIVAAMAFIIVAIIFINLLAVITLTYGLIQRHRYATVERMVKEGVKPGMLMPGANYRYFTKSKADEYMNTEPLRMNYKTYPYLLSMAISDLLIGVAIAPLQLDLYYNDSIWRFGIRLCDFWRSLVVFFCTSSALHTAAIAADRWWTVTRDKVNFPRIKFQKTILYFLWMISAMVSFPVNYIWQIESPGEEERHLESDVCEPITDPTYIILSTTVSFFIPLFLTIAFYVQTIHFFREHWEKTKRRTTLGMTALLTTIVLEPMQRSGNRPKSPLQQKRRSVIMPVSAEGHNSLSVAMSRVISQLPEDKVDNQAEANIMKAIHNMSSLKQSRRLIKAMAVVVVLYVFCWTPLFATTALNAFCDCIDHNLLHSLIDIFTWIGYANSALNPIVYYAALKDYRMLLDKMIKDLLMVDWCYCFKWLRQCRCRNLCSGSDRKQSYADYGDYNYDGNGYVNGASVIDDPVFEAVRFKRRFLQRTPSYISAVRSKRQANGRMEMMEEALPRKSQSEEFYIGDYTFSGNEQRKKTMVVYYDQWSRPISSQSTEFTI